MEEKCALYCFSQASLIQRQKDETSTLSSYYLLLRSLKRVRISKCQLN
uniref:PDIL2-3 n=1 Tax=Arundo donax TaxID=35708 RepID=A0A0A9FRE7_ARUDO